jgi:hypothetical protein
MTVTVLVGRRAEQVDHRHPHVKQSRARLQRPIWYATAREPSGKALQRVSKRSAGLGWFRAMPLSREVRPAPDVERAAVPSRLWDEL